MKDPARIRISRFLSLVLRHQPGLIRVELEPGGWVEVDTLLTRCAAQHRPISRQELEEVVARCEKQRFAFSDDGLRIRASQGHSVEVDLGYERARPPDVLFHGTARDRLASIQVEGLRRMGRHHVHLSTDAEAAAKVGRRHGEPIVLRVDADAMQSGGHPFFRSANGVWLADHVPAAYLDVALGPGTS